MQQRWSRGGVRVILEVQQHFAPTETDPERYGMVVLKAVKMSWQARMDALPLSRVCQRSSKSVTNAFLYRVQCWILIERDIDQGCPIPGHSPYLSPLELDYGSVRRVHVHCHLHEQQEVCPLLAQAVGAPAHCLCKWSCGTCMLACCSYRTNSSSPWPVRKGWGICFIQGLVKLKCVSTFSIVFL